jgi:hypothetical protein
MVEDSSGSPLAIMVLQGIRLLVYRQTQNRTEKELRVGICNSAVGSGTRNGKL